MVKNEADIIELFVRHNLNYIDTMFIADNLSDDGTLEILYSLVEEGLPIIVLTDPELAFMQSKKTTVAYQFIRTKYDFDVMFFLDADEFIKFDKDSYPLDKESLYIDRYHYLYAPAVDPSSTDSNWAESMVYRAASLQSPKCSVTSIKSGDAKKIRIAEGNHHVFHGEERITTYDEAFLGKIYHFPIRSTEQFIRKNILGWIGLMLQDANAQDSSGRNVVGSHWRDSYRFIKDRDFVLEREELVKHLYNGNPDIKDQCVYEPISFDFDIKYHSLVRKDSITRLLLNSYEKSIRSLWAARLGEAVKSNYLRDINYYISKVSSGRTDIRIDKVWWHKPHRLVYEIHEKKLNIAFDLESGSPMFSLYITGRNKETINFLAHIESIDSKKMTQNNKIKLFDCEAGESIVAIEHVLSWLSIIHESLQVK